MAHPVPEVPPVVEAMNVPAAQVEKWAFIQEEARLITTTLAEYVSACSGTNQRLNNLHITVENRSNALGFCKECSDICAKTQACTSENNF
eukprot:3015164-Amphidinium_carterae.1